MPEDSTYALKTKTKAFIDLSLSFIPSALTDDLTTLKNIRSINNSVKNIIMFMPGEVPFNRNIGSKVTSYLFDVPDEVTAGLLSDEIERAITFCEPRISFFEPINGELIGSIYDSADVADATLRSRGEGLGVFVSATSDNNGFEVTVRYRIVGTDQVIRVQEILTPTR